MVLGSFPFLESTLSSKEQQCLSIAAFLLRTCSIITTWSNTSFQITHWAATAGNKSMNGIQGVSKMTQKFWSGSHLPCMSFRGSQIFTWTLHSQIFCIKEFSSNILELLWMSLTCLAYRYIHFTTMELYFDTSMKRFYDRKLPIQPFMSRSKTNCQW